MIEMFFAVMHLQSRFKHTLICCAYRAMPFQCNLLSVVFLIVIVAFLIAKLQHLIVGGFEIPFCVLNFVCSLMLLSVYPLICCLQSVDQF